MPTARYSAAKPPGAGGNGGGCRKLAASLGLEQYEATFRENDVDAELLPNLTADDLKEIGITSLGHRRHLLEAIAALRLEGTPAVDPSGPPEPARPGTSPRLRPPPNAARSA